ncbi:hypothetical protein J6590_059849 [Homalodisca vitripennis]|nr:hypothetical protein J6590_059849 [Homalodisca vitripennis]
METTVKTVELRALGKTLKNKVTEKGVGFGGNATIGAILPVHRRGTRAIVDSLQAGSSSRRSYKQLTNISHQQSLMKYR